MAEPPIIEVTSNPDGSRTFKIMPRGLSTVAIGVILADLVCQFAQAAEKEGMGPEPLVRMQIVLALGAALAENDTPQPQQTMQ